MSRRVAAAGLTVFILAGLGTMALFLAGRKTGVDAVPKPTALQAEGKGSTAGVAQPGTAASAGLRPSPPDQSDSSAKRAGPLTPEAEGVIDPGGVKDRYPRNQVLDERVGAVAPDGTYERVRIVKTDMKYPLVRVVERCQVSGVGCQEAGFGVQGSGQHSPFVGNLVDKVPDKVPDKVVSPNTKPLTPSSDTLLFQTAMVADHVTLKVKEGVSEAQLAAVAAANGGTILRKLRVPGPGTYLVQFPKATVDTIPNAVAALGAQSGTIDYVNPDYVVYALDTIPNDPLFGQLWGMNNTSQIAGTGSVVCVTNTIAGTAIIYSPVTGGVTGTTYYCGLGNPGDFPAAVSNNIALIQRGTLTFAEKATNAKAKGAKAVIIYNNSYGAFSGTFSVAGDWLPTLAISDSDGAVLLALTNTSVTVTINGCKLDADIDAPEAWDVSTGDTNIIVGVIDTGVDYNHPDLRSNMWVNAAEKNGVPGVDDDGNGYIDDVYGFDFVGNNDADPMDDFFHGTHVAGTIGGVGSNGVGVAGVCWKVRLMALKFLDSAGSGALSDGTEAIWYATRNRARLTSNSWGGGGFDQGLKDAIDAAGRSNILFVAAAGNSSGNNDANPTYPGSYDSSNIIAVAATDNNDLMATFSCYGQNSVDIGAPGVNILSCYPTTMTAAMTQRGDPTNYNSISGTSMATPHVAGACALMAAAHPELSAMQIKNLILAQADQIPALAGKCVTGARLNIGRAIVLSGEPILRLWGQRITDPAPGGNGDGRMTPGETGLIAITMMNASTNGATTVVSTIACTNTAITIVTNTVTFGNIPGLTAAASSNTFVFTVATGTPPQQVFFDLVTTDGAGHAWTNTLLSRVRGQARISGTVRQDGAPGIGFPVNCSGQDVDTGGWTNQTVYSDLNGKYSFDLLDGSFTVYSYWPQNWNIQNRKYVVTPPDWTNLDFEATTVTMSGRVTDAKTGNPMTNASVDYYVVSDAPDANMPGVAPYAWKTWAIRGNTTTDMNGNYTFSSVMMTTSLVSVTPWVAGYSNAASITVTVPDNATGVNFAVSAPDINIGVSPSSVSRTVKIGQVVTQSLVIANSGAASMPWTLWQESDEAYQAGTAVGGWISLTYNIYATAGFAYDGVLNVYNNMSPQALYRHNPANGALLETWDMSMHMHSSSMYGVDWDGRNFVFSDAMTWYKDVRFINPATQWVVKALPVFKNDTSYPVGVVYGGGYLWMVSSDSRIVKADPLTGATLASFAVPDAWGGIEYFSGALWVGSGNNNTIYKISPTDGRVIRTFSAGTFGLDELAKDRAGNLWVHDYNNWNPRARLLRIGTAAWLSQSASSGTVTGGGSNTVNLTFNSSTAGLGVHTAMVSVATSDPDEPEKLVPVLFTVTASQSPVIDSPASVTPNPVTLPATAALSVAAHDPDGDPLVFTWSQVSGPGTATFVPNGTAASLNSVASFSRAGTYVLRVTVSNSNANEIATSDVAVSAIGIETDVSFVTVPEGSNATFRARLVADPLASATVTAAWVSGDADISVSGGSSLMFDSGNWTNWQTVTLAAATDPDILNGSAIIGLSAGGLMTVNVTATEREAGTALQVMAGIGGTVSPAGQTNVLLGTPVMVSAVPASGRTFLRWVCTEGAATFANALAPTTTVTLASAATIRANFGPVDGTVWAWGNNTYGGVGDGTTSTRYSPVMVMYAGQPFTNVTDVSVGYDHTLALRADSNVWVWGRNNYGQLGIGTTNDQYNPVRVTALSNIIAVAAGSFHSAALDSSSNVWTWGRNWRGQLGNGISVAETVPTPNPVQALISNVIAIACGANHTLALKGDGTVWAWGWNQFAQLGDGTSIDRSNAVQVVGLSNVTAIASENNHSLALKGDGSLWIWGTGGGFPTDPAYTPQQVAISNVVAMSAGGHSLGLKGDGSLWAWGVNWNGQLGDGNIKPLGGVYPPVQSLMSNAVAVSAGGNYSMALDGSGGVWSWGYNYYGNLGDGTNLTRATPAKIAGSRDFIQVRAGNYHTAAIRQNQSYVSVTTSVSSVSVPEGGTNTFSVKLSAQPATNVTISVVRESGDTDISITNGTNLVFTTSNWNTNQTVTLAAAEDSDASNGTAVIWLSGADFDARVTATEADNDATLTVYAGTGGTVSPSGAVVVNKGASVGISASQTPLYMFANWGVLSGSATFANSNAAGTTVIVTNDATIQANFAMLPVDKPTIVNQPASGVTTGSAYFNGVLAGTGSSACAVCVLWGTQNGGQTWNWANTNWLTPPEGGWTNSSPLSTNITFPSTPATYYYTFAATNGETNAVASPSKSFINGEVAVQASDSTAQYYPPDTGAYTISRPEACTNEALTVNFTMSGTAIQGVHYTLSQSGSVTLGAGVTSAVVTVTALPGSVGDATLTLTASSLNPFPLAAAPTATVTIAESSLVTWYWKGVTPAWTNTANWTNGVGANPSGMPLLSTEAVFIDTPAGSNNPVLNLAGGPVSVAMLTLGQNTASTLTITNGNVSDKYLNVIGHAIIGPTGVLTHAADWSTGTTVGSESNRLCLVVGGNMTITAGGRIDVTGKGYPGYGAGTGYGPGGGANSCGGGYGGQGGNGNGGNTYGSVTNPVNSGSAGGNYSALGMTGGGTVVLSVGGQLTLSGSILANGNDRNDATARGAGAGGSVNITAGSLAGSGTISACGGTNSGGYGAGGGGRIAVVLANASDSAFASLAAIRAWGGANPQGAAYVGAAGTVYLKGTNQTYGRVIVNNNSLTTTRTTLIQNQTVLMDSIVATNSGVFALGPGAILDLSKGCVLQNPTSSPPLTASRFIIASSFNGQILWPDPFTLSNATLSVQGTNSLLTGITNLVIASGGVLTHEAVTSSGSNPEDNMLRATIAGNLTINSGGAVDVSSMGYGLISGVGQGPGYGGYGGQAGGSTITYGSLTNPVNSGSAGVTYGSVAGSGGGAAVLVIGGDLTLNGSILTDGGSPGYGGGGSGGSVNIVASRLFGAGTISAKGGNVPTGASNGNGGGGGRIAVVLTNADNSAFAGLTTIRAYGGSPKSGSEYGAAGTVYLKGTNQAYGTLTVDNAGITTTRSAMMNASVRDTTVGDVVIRNSGSLALASQTLGVYGSWSNGALFSAYAGSVVELKGTATCTLFGSSSFAGLTCTNAGKTLRFQAGTTNTVTEGLRFSGADSGNRLSLESTDPAKSWFIKAQTGSYQYVVAWLAVSNSVAVTNGGNKITASYSLDNGGNTNWIFGDPGAILWTGTVSTDWNTPGNWNLNRAPLPADPSITIGAGTYQPKLDKSYTGAAGYSGSLAISNGASLDLNGYSLSIGGAVTNGGALIARGSETLTFNGDVDFTGGTFTSRTSTVILGKLSGTQNVAAGGCGFNTIQVSNAVTLNVSGGFTAARFDCRVPGAWLNFAAGSTNTVGSLILQGASGNYVTVRSSASPTAAKLNVTGYTAVNYVDAQDSDASGGLTIYAIDSVQGAGGNTPNWDFGLGNRWVGIGAAGTGSWFTASNWSKGTVPGSNTYALVNGGNPTLGLTNAYTIKGLSLGAAAASTLTVTNGNLDTRFLFVDGNVGIGPNGTLTHPLGTAHTLNLKTTGNLAIDAGGSINVDGMGNSGLGAPGSRAGAGHGGTGGSSGAAGGTTYGSVTNPVLHGSSGTLGNGGGVAILNVGGALNNSGAISAKGLPQVYYADNLPNGSSGSGGSINITVAGAIASAGTINVDGGNGDAEGSNDQGAGGGRIAIILTGSGQGFSGVTLTNVTAYGGHCAGSTDGQGGAGTVYLKTQVDNGKLIVDNRNQPYDSPGVRQGVTLVKDYSYNFSSIILTNYGVCVISNNASLDLTGCTLLTPDSTTNSIKSRLIGSSSGNAWTWPAAWTNNGCLSWLGTNVVTVGSLTMAANAILTHEASSPNNKVNLNVAGNLTIDQGAAIWVCQKGAAPDGAPAGSRAGAGYGGEGGGNNVAVGTSHGSVTNPVTGGSQGNNGALGGGAVILAAAGSVSHNGVIAANGGDSANTKGAGSGGSILLTAGALGGTGVMQANGGSLGAGADQNNDGSGGGGRIAVVLTNSATFGSVVMNADGGTTTGGDALKAGAGTIYLQGTNSAFGRLIVPASAGTIRRTLVGPLTTGAVAGDVELRSGALLAISNNTLTVYGSWSNAAPNSFTNPATAGTVVFAGSSPATVWGRNTWSNLTIATAGKTVSFEAGKTQLVYGVATFSNVTMQSTAPGTWWYLRKPGTGTQDVGVVTVQDSNATNGWTFSAAIGSTDGGNNVNWVIPLAVLPAAPSGLMAVAAGTSRVDLAWTDNAGNETGYVIGRSLDSNIWVVVTTAAANTTNYPDTGLGIDTLYYYRVAASNAAGLSAYAYGSARTWTAYEAWRHVVFTAVQLTNTLISGDEADPDGDKFANWKEYAAGTDPWTNTSYLGVTQFAVTPAGGGYVVTWQSVTGKVYTLQAATNLAASFENVRTNIPATPVLNVHTDAVNGAVLKFYRVLLEQ